MGWIVAALVIALGLVAWVVVRVGSGARPEDFDEADDLRW